MHIIFEPVGNKYPFEIAYKIVFHQSNIMNIFFLMVFEGTNLTHAYDIR